MGEGKSLPEGTREPWRASSDGVRFGNNLWLPPVRVGGQGFRSVSACSAHHTPVMVSPTPSPSLPWILTWTLL